ncbi:hypothetical protein CBS101457_004790 [Exobasidium rhododendri]|nr:hypothetical protein CBS101457_004790 [Exobasidium rhododendri]
MADEAGADFWSHVGSAVAWLPFSSSNSSLFRIRGRKSLFFVGFVAGLTVSLGSLATALVLADVRTQRKRRSRYERRGDRGHSSSQSHSKRRNGHIDIRSGEIVKGVEGLIGETPLMRIESLSRLTGCEILGKAEWLNPGGSPKDRVAKRILDDAEEEGLLHPNTGSCIFEGTVGSTGISLATLARAKGYRCSIVIPDDVSKEKAELLRMLGAEIDAVRPRGIVDPKHFVNEAKRRAEAFGNTELIGPNFRQEGANASLTPGWEGEYRDDLVLTTNAHVGAEGRDMDELENEPRGFFADQFENVSNFYAHYNGTGPEIWRQTGGMIDAFVAGAGTGGTLAGVSAFLKEKSAPDEESESGSESGMEEEGGGRGSSWFSLRQSPNRIRASDNENKADLPWVSTEGDRQRQLRIVLADPQGSGLFNKVKYGVMYSQTEAEGKRRRHQVDTVIEGIGLNRLTKNFQLGLPYYDDAISVTDEEAVCMSRHLVLNDGLFLGSSSAVNCVAAIKTALRLKSERSEKEREIAPITVVTILCDSGSRHLSKFWNDDHLDQLGISISSDISEMLHYNSHDEDSTVRV